MKLEDRLNKRFIKVFLKGILAEKIHFANMNPHPEGA